MPHTVVGMTTSYSSFDDDIPERLPVTQLPPVRSAHDLYRYWRRLMGPLGLTGRRLWISFIDPDGRVDPVLPQIDDLPVRAGVTDCGGLMIMFDHVREFFAGGAVALLYTRPGRHPMDDDDRSWGQSLTAAARAADIALWPVHFANDEELLVFAPDDLVGP